jgi:hypothetical protein
MMVRMVAGLASIGRDERLGQDQRGLGLASDLTASKTFLKKTPSRSLTNWPISRQGVLGAALDTLYC